MPKVRLQGGAHYTREKDSDNNEQLVKHSDGDVFDAPQSEIDKFPDKLIPLSDSSSSAAKAKASYTVEARPGEPGKFNVVGPSGSVVNPDEGLDEGEANSTAKKLNARGR